MGSSTSFYLSILYTVIILLRVWGRTVTRKNGKNSEILIIKVFKVWKDISETHAVPYVKYI